MPHTPPHEGHTAPAVGFTPTTQAKAQYTHHESRVRRAVSSIAESLAKGDVTPMHAFGRLAPLLKDAHRQAFLLGKRVGSGGYIVLLTTPELKRVDALADAQISLLRQWLSGPLVKPGGVGVGPRADMYALACYASYQTGLAFGLLQVASGEKGMALYQDDPIWEWRRSKAPGLQSCADCVKREKGGPYSLTQLLTMGMPGAGKTKCLSRCRCRLVLIASFGSDILRARTHRRAQSTGYHGIADPETLAHTHHNTVGQPASPSPSEK